MMQMNIVATDKKAHVVINGGDEIICPIVKDREHSYSVNIKKLGYARSFISIGELEDKTLDFDETSLNSARTSAKRGPKAITLPDDAFNYLDEDQSNILVELLDIVNAGYKADFDAALEAKAAAKVKVPKQKVVLTEEEKLERQIARLMAKKQALHDKALEENGDPVDEVVED